MSKVDLKISVASKGKLLVKSTFNNYDVCLAGYTGCQFACSYCYVRFFVKDDEKEWGDFVRVRAHTKEALPKELDKGFIRIQTGKETVGVLNNKGKLVKKGIYTDLPISEARLVLGTMTDPYQPIERKFRVTRTALDILTKHPNQFKKVGIFTRSPIVLDDLELIQKLPQARVHYTVTPFPPDVMRTIEPISPKTERRWEVLNQLKQAGIRTHVNVSPVMPIISDDFVDEWARILAELGPAEFFVDPMQPYAESFEAFERAMSGRSEWATIKQIMTNRAEFDAWKAEYKRSWQEAWARHGHRSPDTLPIWCDHVHHTWVDMRTGQQMDRQHYGEEAVGV